MGKVIRNGQESNFTGFYHTRLFPEVVVSKDGRIINIEDGTPVNIIHMGGRCVCYVYDVDIKQKRYASIQFIVASALLPQPPTAGSRVTTLDGNPENASITNIAWANSNSHINTRAVEFVRRDVGYDHKQRLILKKESPDGYAGFQTSETYPEIAVDHTGTRFINMTSGRELKPSDNGSRNILSVKRLSADGNLTTVSVPVAHIVAEAYVYRPSEEHKYVQFIDGNAYNAAPSNLYWSKERKAMAGTFIREVSEQYQAFKHGDQVDVVGNGDLTSAISHQWVEPVESEDYPGHFCSDRYPWVVVSSDGLSIIDVNTGKSKSQHNINGYRYINTFSTDTGKKSNVGVHRIVASAFKRPDHEGQTHVNHINLIRDDNRYVNLEWVTPNENAEHAHFYSLSNGNLRPVKALDIRNGSVSVYESALECSRQLGIDKSTLWGMLERRELYPWQKTHIFIYLDEPWPRMDLIVNPKELAKNRSHRVEAWNVVEDKVISAEGHTEIAKELGMSRASIQSYLRRKNTHVMNGYVFRYTDSGVEWPNREEALAYMRESDTRAVLVHTETGEVKVYPTKKAAGEVVGMNKTDASRWFRRGECVAGYKPYPYIEYMEKQNNATL